MAYRVTNGAGTSFNTTTNWDEGVNTPSIHASTSITVTSGGVTSATFTAPNITNACTGVLVPIAARGTAGNIIARRHGFVPQGAAVRSRDRSEDY